ncbi:MAG: hypothetical protein EOP25_08295 [Rhodococcus sp. (in: high G+C Gram-positive bacteria)]|nr:MAG: hypothetical protein EOP25_08295 [Rhodococcus sp. (in: high G+C Gram-positive bacteria)]
MPSLSLTPHLPQPCTQLWDWQMHAQCRNTGTELFFAHDDEGRGARIRRERQAKAVCVSLERLRTCYLLHSSHRPAAPCKLLSRRCADPPVRTLTVRQSTPLPAQPRRRLMRVIGNYAR